MAMGLADREAQSDLMDDRRRDLVPIKVHKVKAQDPICSVKSSKGSLQPLQQRTTTSRSSVGASSATNIRSRFLNKLGISKESNARTISLVQSTRRSRTESFEESLKGDNGTLQESSEFGSLSTVSSHSTAPSCMDRRSVSFGTTVTVHPIPSRNLYSDRIRKALWTPSDEMRENAARNCYEFAAESWDWRKVVDDDDMILYQGERIHPVHFVREFSMRQQFSPSASIHSSS